MCASSNIRNIPCDSLKIAGGRVRGGWGGRYSNLTAQQLLKHEKQEPTPTSLSEERLYCVGAVRPTSRQGGAGKV